MAVRDPDELLDQYRLHDDWPAFADLVSHYRPLVKSVCRRYIIDPGDLDDAVQETFLKLARKAHHVETKGQGLSAWLGSTAARTAIDFARRTLAERRHRQVAREAMDCSPVQRPGVCWEAIDACLSASLAGLDEPTRQLITARFLSGVSLQEIAVQLGASLPTLYRRVNKALAHLRQGLEARGFASPEEAAAGRWFDVPGGLGRPGRNPSNASGVFWEQTSLGAGAQGA